MAKSSRRHADDLRGAGRLATEATRGVTALVEAMHRTIASGPAVLGKPLQGPATLLTSASYGAVRGVSGLVGAGIDAALGGLAPLLGESVPGPTRDALLSVLGGVLGDYLVETDNPLALPMQLRQRGAAFETSDSMQRGDSDTLLVTVHGCCMNDRQWRHDEHDHAEALAQAFGWTRVDVRYNTGLHVSTNGLALAQALERFATGSVDAFERIVVLCHSMGGLVARSAIAQSESRSHVWRRLLRGLVCLGTPHHGAPLERGGNWLDVLLTVTPYSAPLAQLGKIRSAGVTDLRFGNVLEEHWQGRDRFALSDDVRTAVPLPQGVACHAVAGQRGRAGDGLVPVDSALGVHRTESLSLRFPEANTMVARDTGHLELLSSPAVYTQLETWMSALVTDG